MKQACYYLLLLTLIFSCKEDKKEEKVQEPVKIETPSNAQNTGSMKVTIEVKFSNPDIIEIFYREFDNNFNWKESVKNEVSGGNVLQKSMFIIPDQTLASHFRFDFGEKEDLEVTIFNIAIEFNGKTFEIPQNEIMNSFNSSDWVEIIDHVSAKLKPTKISDRVDPKLTFNTETVNKIIDYFDL